MDPNSPIAFLGLKSGQIRKDSLIQGGYWYSPDGVCRGYGDLNEIDILRIRSRLSHEGLFIILPEEFGPESQSKFELMRKAQYVITRAAVFQVVDFDPVDSTVGAIQFRAINRNEMFSLLVGVNTPKEVADFLPRTSKLND